MIAARAYMKKNDFIRIALFGIGIVFVYAFFSNLYIPSSVPHRQVEEISGEIGALTGAELAAFGESVYTGKGSCALCHDAVGGRAPSLDSIAVTAAGRVLEARYKGKASDALGYIYESMADPSAYVVAGYGAAGTDDTLSPMPGVLGGQIELTEAEVTAVIAYLQKRAGVEVTAGSATGPLMQGNAPAPDKIEMTR